MPKKDNNFILRIFFIGAIFLLPLALFPVVRNVLTSSKLMFVYLGIILGSILGIFELFRANKVKINFASKDALPWFIVLLGIVSWFMADTGIKYRSIIEVNPWISLLSLLVFFFIYIQTKLPDQKVFLIKILSYSAAILVLTSIVLFIVPDNKFPLKIVSDFLVIPDGQWSPIGSSLELLIFLLPLTVYWFIKLAKDTTSPGNKKISFLPVLFLFIFIIGMGLNGYEYFRSNPIVLDYYSSWYIATESLKRNPLFGVGPNNYMTAYNLYRPIETNQNFANIIFNTPANFLFKMWTEIGLAAMIIWLTFVFTTLKDAWRKKHQFFYPLLILFLAQVFAPTGYSSLFLFLLLSYSVRSRTALILPQANWTKKAITVLTFLILIPSVFFLSKLYLAESYFIKSLVAIARNDANGAYLNQQKSIKTVPYIVDYRIARSQSNLALANSIAQKEDPTDKDKENIALLIQDAINEAKAAVALETKNVTAWQNLANTYRQIINLAEGADQWTISAYQQAITLNPYNPFLRIDLGGVFYSLNRYEEAAVSFENAVRLKNDNPNSWYNWAWSLKQANKTQDAIEALQQAIVLVEKDSQDYEKANQELEAWMAELGEEEPEETPQTDEHQELSVPTPIVSPTIEPIQLPEDAAPQIEITPEPEQETTEEPKEQDIIPQTNTP
jgi:tetratricopeptide (TPR) repeat protein